MMHLLYPIQRLSSRLPSPSQTWALLSVSAGLMGMVTVNRSVPVAIAQLPPAIPIENQQSMPVLVVNPTTGDDQGNGTADSPLKTITKALDIAQENTVILLSPGIYSSETGETFPLILKSGVTIQGNPRTRGEAIVIRGGGRFQSPTANQQNITLLAANQAGLMGVTVSNPNPEGYGLWIESSSPVVVDNTFSGNGKGAIVVKGNSAPTIRSNYFYASSDQGIWVEGTLQADVRENVFAENNVGIGVVSPGEAVQAAAVIKPKPSDPLESANLIETPEPSSPPISAASFPIPSSLQSEVSTPSNLSSPPESSVAKKPLENSVQGLTSQPLAQTGTIDIAVPLPEATAEPSTLTPSPSGTGIPVLTSNSDDKPVTDSVPVLSDQSSAPVLGGNPSVVASDGMEIPARYRVLVPVQNEQEQELVRSLVPDAFRTSVNGQPIMQAGSFNSSERAEALRQLLNRNGLRARVEPIHER